MYRYPHFYNSDKEKCIVCIVAIYFLYIFDFVFVFYVKGIG